MRCAGAALAFLALIAIVRCAYRTDTEYFRQLARDELNEALQLRWNTGVARNVIVFIGDGMGLHTVTATRIFKGGESHRLVYEQFPHMGLLKTYNANHLIPDSASSASALLTGVKVNQDTVGVDATVVHEDCVRSLNESARLESLALLAQKAGKATGFVTNMRVTHETPAPLFAYSSDDDWECDARMPASASACKDIGRQLMEDEPGRNLNVIMGGGRQGLMSNPPVTEADPLNMWGCIRQDGRNLFDTYVQDKESRGLRYSVVGNNAELAAMNPDETDYLLGVFANGHLDLEHARDSGPNGMPSLTDMVEASIRVLQKNENGFFLLVEGGNIDMSHHRGVARRAINEASVLEDAVRLAVEMTNEEDTLIIVTSDHSDSMAINGYTRRGESVFGVVENPDPTGQPYTTLTYGTGGIGSSQVYVTADGNVARRDPNLDDTSSFDYEQQATAETTEVYHGGGDVGIFARGPWSHLFHNVHESHYMYHVISHAARFFRDS